MNEAQNFANFHLPYGLKFFHKDHPKHKLNYSWPHIQYLMYMATVILGLENKDRVSQLPDENKLYLLVLNQLYRQGTFANTTS